MKVKNLFFTCFVFLLSIVFFSCSETPITPEISVTEGNVNYFAESMDFPSVGGTKILNFTSNVKWSLAVSETQGSAKWCTVSLSEGLSGTYNVSVTVAKNEGYDDRNVVLILTAGELKKNIIVNQKQKNAITLTTDRFEIRNDGGTVDIEVNANVEYSVEIPEAYRSWISSSQKSRALSSKILSFDIAENKEYDKREGEIRISSDNITETVKIYQAGAAILILSQNEFNLGSDGGTVSIDISSNFEFDVDMPDVDWIKQADKSRAVSSHTLVYNVIKNTSHDNREAVIVFKDSNSDKKESVTIRQKQKDAIILSGEKVELPQDGGIFSVDVNSNVDYSIEIPSSCSSWLSRTNVPSSASSSRSLIKSTPYFKASNSENYDKREGEIIFRYNDVTETFKVYQSGGAVIVLGQDTYDIGGGATTVSVQLKSNIDYSTSISCDWISENSSRAVSSSIKKFNVTTNKTGKSRTGKITFKTSDGSRSATVSVIQKPVVDAKSLNISFTNTSGTMGGNLYIGKNYGFSVSSTPNNADVDYEWHVEDEGIAIISGNGNTATLTTKNFGRSNVVVTEKNSGISQSYEFGTCVTDFQFTENTGEFGFGSPMITMLVGDQYKLSYTCKPNYATNIFSDLRAFNLKEQSGRVMVLVDKPTVADIDPTGIVTAKKTGLLLISSNNGYGVHKNNYDNDEVLINVLEYYTEKEDNNTFGTANKYRGPVVCSLYAKNDVDVFEVTLPKTPTAGFNSIVKFDVTIESLDGLDLMGHQVYVFDENGEEFGLSNPSGTRMTHGRSGYAGKKMYIQISWNNESIVYNKYWNGGHRVKLTVTPR